MHLVGTLSSSKTVMGLVSMTSTSTEYVTKLKSKVVHMLMHVTLTSRQMLRTGLVTSLA